MAKCEQKDKGKVEKQVTGDSVADGDASERDGSNNGEEKDNGTWGEMIGWIN